MYLVRNDPTGHCFLQYWRDQQPGFVSDISPAPNHDNGALVAAMLMLGDTDIATQCIFDMYKTKTSANTSSLYSGTGGGYSRRLNGDAAKGGMKFDRRDYDEHYCMIQNEGILYSPRALPTTVRSRIYVNWPHEGFWRSHEKPLAADASMNASMRWYKDRHLSCFGSSDIFGHGDKDLLLHMYGTQRPVCDSAAIDKGLGQAHRCPWLSLDEELVVLRRYCLVDSPRCIRYISAANYSFVGDLSTSMYRSASALHASANAYAYAASVNDSVSIARSANVALYARNSGWYVNLCFRRKQPKKSLCGDYAQQSTRAEAFWKRFSAKLTDIETPVPIYINDLMTSEQLTAKNDKFSKVINSRFAGIKKRLNITSTQLTIEHRGKRRRDTKKLNFARRKHKQYQ
jgi:hypothetical protein